MKYRMIRQTDCLQRENPNFITYIVQKQVGFKWIDVFRRSDEIAAIDYYGQCTRDYPVQVRYAMKMKEHMAIVNSTSHDDLGGLVVTQEARIKHKSQFKAALNRAILETAGMKSRKGIFKDFPEFIQVVIANLTYKQTVKLAEKKRKTHERETNALLRDQIGFRTDHISGPKPNNTAEEINKRLNDISNIIEKNNGIIK